MKKVIKLTEKDLTNIIKKVLSEQKESEPSEAEKQKNDKLLLDAFCGVKYGMITTGPLKGKQFCDIYNNLSSGLEEKSFGRNCPNTSIFTLPQSKYTSKKSGFDEFYQYVVNGGGGSKLAKVVTGRVCQEWYYFDYVDSNNKKFRVWNTGFAMWYPNGDFGTNNYSGVNWEWKQNQPVINLPYTQKSTGLAKTEDDIKTKGKILTIGSRGDIVKALQFNLIFYQKMDDDRIEGGKVTINPGCKKSRDGEYWAKDCDGIFGKNTQLAVIQYQKKKGLKGTNGVVGAETLTRMGDLDFNPEAHI